jgi:serine/threonine protein kinase
MYMSPEQLDSTVAIDGRTDIWALGVVLFELLAGKPPFGGKSSANIMTAVIRDPAPKLRTLRPDAPDALEEVVVRCLEKEREQRYASVIDLAEAIAPFCGKGADDTVNRISQILAHATSEEFESNRNSRTSTETNAFGQEDSSGRQSDRRSSGPGRDSAEPSLAGAAHTHGGSRTSSTRRALVVGFALAATLAIVGIIVRQPNPQPTLASPPTSTSAALESAPESIPPPSAEPSADVVEVNAPLSNDVTITFTGAPNDTKVFRGDAELGTAATPLRLPRSNEKIMLRFIADTYAPAEVELLPNVDQTLAITLKPGKAGAAPLIKRKVPKELEPF